MLSVGNQSTCSSSAFSPSFPLPLFHLLSADHPFPLSLNFLPRFLASVRLTGRYSSPAPVRPFPIYLPVRVPFFLCCFVHQSIFSFFNLPAFRPPPPLVFSSTSLACFCFLSSHPILLLFSCSASILLLFIHLLRFLFPPHSFVSPASIPMLFVHFISSSISRLFISPSSSIPFHSLSLLLSSCCSSQPLIFFSFLRCSLPSPCCSSISSPSSVPSHSFVFPPIFLLFISTTDIFLSFFRCSLFHLPVVRPSHPTLLFLQLFYSFLAARSPSPPFWEQWSPRVIKFT